MSPIDSKELMRFVMLFFAFDCGAALVIYLWLKFGKKEELK